MKKRKTIMILLSLICGMGLVSCGDNNENSYEATYTVTWINDNGDILEVDSNVKEGTIPTYDGETPTKVGNAQYSYVFAGWDHEIVEVYENTTYTATFSQSTNKYVVTWVNYNGDVLEVDEDVEYGTMPSFDSATPTKEGNEEINYIFSGWSPSISEVKGNATYTATFIERHNGELIPGADPIVSEDGKTIQYGFYPQTYVSDKTLIAELDNLTTTEVNGWYLYNGDYYTKEIAKVYNNENYTFDDGTTIINGSEYWFKCEIIEWKVLSVESGSYFLLASKLLDTHNYYKNYSNRTIDNATVYANNYEQSDIRAWLNDDFYNTAFNLNNSYIHETIVSNSTTTDMSSDNQYICNDTNDKVYLLSYQDYLNSNYGFGSSAAEASSTREARTTDYARARGAWCNTRDTSKPGLKFNGSYWTRSPSNEYYYCAWNVNSSGYLSTYAVDGDSHCVRPSISISVA
ncbi:MAG: hypothetical protein J1F32_02845 [Erysipelotrichales bacterium]|nr:hypothetical protein [Erysipelotrichales bacterium]